MYYVIRDIPFGRNIQNERMKKNLTQMELVREMQLMGSHISRSTLANIETGKRNIKGSDLKAIKIISNVDYEKLFAE